MKNSTTISNPAEFTERFINQTNSPVFLTGKAGTGKTTLLRKIVETTHKNTVIVAPTGIAALNAGGVTIHSFFQLPFSSFIPDFISEGLVQGNTKFESKETLKRHFHFNKTRQNLIRNVELLIIDEVSMLRADLLDAIDWTLRNVRKNNSPFGGLQVLFIGDLLQLPPVIKPEEWSVLQKYYHGIFFFNAQVLQEQAPVYIELDKIFRQDDQLFIDLLNNLRNNQVTHADQELLQNYVNPAFDSTKEDGYITLTTHNSKADQMNATALNSLKEKSITYSAEIKGDFPPHLFPLEKETELKVGAQIMFIKNDISFEKNFYNGKMGVIQSLSSSEIEVFFKEEKRSITVDKYEWTNIKYSLNEQKGEIEEETLGTFVHYPIKLAWAITIHKSQGLTFEKAVLDISNVFAPGQAYVALSRLRSLNGLVLLKPLSMNGLVNDKQVVSYASNKAPEERMQLYLDQETARFVYTSLQQAFDWYDYTTKWATFEIGFKNQGPKTEKGKDHSWVATQMQTVQSTFDAARKFQNQITNLFSKEKPEWEFIHDRVQAAYQYFFKPLDAQVYSIMKRRYELAKIKKTKSYSEELEEVEQEVIAVVHRLMKVRLLMEAILNGKPFTKETVKSAEITNYVIAKGHSIQQELRANRSMMDEMLEEDFVDVIELVKPKKIKEEKVVKKNTYEITFELFEEGKTMEEIANERQLGLSTIEGHFAKLIQEEKIDISAVLDPKRISEIETYLEEAEGKSLGAIKDELGDKVTYGELKLVQASKML
ncbi:helix-turn-helix domain-containing protein [Fluviicola taffensis]|uniref:AAA ATPase n=1 Tax=Fluviicola taffensis (strain DSM 16823 / NCIMB 13979 / RW262) TaxID=755732 RepID=F2IJG8_FLUTR|nr:helix-turn-helix domain-containing protein [Fluviicola taffensis]AEA42856.1 AAA ATPase [Fluviicola taffensis DSM 16823]